MLQIIRKHQSNCMYNSVYYIMCVMWHTILLLGWGGYQFKPFFLFHFFLWWFLHVIFQLSKEVKKLRGYEEGLLKNYQKYLQILEETVQGRIILTNDKLYCLHNYTWAFLWNLPYSVLLTLPSFSLCSFEFFRVC